VGSDFEGGIDRLMGKKEKKKKKKKEGEDQS